MSEFADRGRIDILSKEKTDLSLEKRAIEIDLGEITNTIRSNPRLPQETYRTYCRRQNELKSKILAIERKISAIKDELRGLASQDEVTWKQMRENLARNLEASVTGRSTPQIVKDLCQLRAQYQQFSADHTRVSSMRVMASEFANELDRVIKSHVNSA